MGSHFNNFSHSLLPSPRPVDGYRTLDSGYRAPSRQQLDPYAAQPQVSRGMRALGSALEVRYGQGPGHYGLEDDQRSVGYDDYGMGPPPIHPGGYGTMPRLGAGPGGVDRRRLRYDTEALLCCHIVLVCEQTNKSNQCFSLISCCDMQELRGHFGW